MSSRIYVESYIASNPRRRKTNNSNFIASKMSTFSPYDVFMDMVENLDVSASHRSSSQRSIDVESLDDSITFDSDTLNEFGNVVSMASLIQNQTELSQDDYEGQTIVSSHDSGASIPVPEASQEIFAISPHPRIVTSSAQSLSTVCTDLHTWQDLRSAPNDDDDSDSLDSSPSPSKSLNEINSEAKALLSVLEPRQKLLPLPPAPLATSTSEDFTETAYSAEDYVPENFICGICKDVVVGALTLNCNCVSSVVCCSCWEAQNTSSSSQQKFSDKLGYVWVSSPSSLPCPSCKATVKSIVPCHALDVAIFQIILNLPVRELKARSLKRCYNSRLEVWRQTVIERNEMQRQKEEVQRDDLLARYLQEEEDYFRGTTKIKEKSLSAEHTRTSTLLFLGQAAIAIVAATLLSMGLKSMKRR